MSGRQRSAPADLVIPVVVGGIAAVMMIEASDWVFRSRLFPMATGSAVLFLSLLEFGAVLAGRSAPVTDLDTTESDERDAHAAARFVLWMLAYLTAIWVVGFIVGTVVVSALFLWAARESRLAMAATSIGIFLLFRLLHELVSIPFPEGRVLDLL